MKILTYLAFTVLSIAIQFVVMDLIQEKNKIDDRQVDNNETKTSQKKFSEILKKYAEEPHALYFRTQAGVLIKRRSTKKGNTSIPDVTFESTTDFSSTVFDVLYDDNTTISEDVSTTESLYTSTELDNVTDITIFGKKNATEVKPKKIPNKTEIKDCSCNLMYNICDINCCCDNDCTIEERETFLCIKSSLYKEETKELCYSQFTNHYIMGSSFDHLFCVVKNNMPDRRNIAVSKHDPSVFEKSFKWHTHNYDSLKPLQEFDKLPYKYGTPVWLLRNNSVFYIDLPTTTVNNYCDDRKPLRFLKDEKVKCNVKITDLEILKILSTAEKTSIISVTNKSLNTSALNCSTLHCTNWTIILCDETSCTNYNKSLHDPVCTESVCTDFALKVEYTFNYYDNKIMNASIKLHTQKVPLNIPFVKQEVQVKFIIGNATENDIVELSGSPGYIPGLPVIISHHESNHTESFFNNTAKLKKYISYPGNEKGACVKSERVDNFVVFGMDKRMKCRFYHIQKELEPNATEACNNFQRNITRLLGMEHKVVVSPFGSPGGMSDEDWLTLKVARLEAPVYGGYNTQKTKLNCYNIITRWSMLFTYADVSEKPAKKNFKILSAKIDVSPSNITLNTEEISAVITIDTVFIDETKPSIFEYAGGPQLNIHLPKDFFFPFPSKAKSFKVNAFLIVSVIVILSV